MDRTTQKAVTQKLTRDFGFGRDEFRTHYDPEFCGYGVVLVTSMYATSSHAARMMSCLRSAGFRVERVSTHQLEVA